MNEKLAGYLKKYLTVIAVVVVCLYFGSKMRGQSVAKGDFDYRSYGMLPVIDGGRFKPMDTVARTKLMILTHRVDYYDRDEEKRYPGTKWLLDVQTTQVDPKQLPGLFANQANRFPAITQKVFRIEHEELVRWLNLKLRPGVWRYSLVEIMFGDNENHQVANFQKIHFEVEAIRQKEPKHWNLFEGKLKELHDHIIQFMQLSTHAVPLAIPNANGNDQWLAFRDAHEKAELDAKEQRSYKVYLTLLRAYHGDDPTMFNTTLKTHLDELQQEMPSQMRAIRVEMFFNEFAPFYRCLEVYGVLALLCGLAWLPLPGSWTQSIQRACYAAMAVTFVVHLSGLIIRMYLQDRMFVFVTNLYSSAVFIGLGSVGICLIVEAFYRNGIATVVGGVAGFCTLIIGHMLSMSGDTLEMMQAVLDTNFWLATHVTCITLGYVTAFVAGLMGVAYIFLGLFTNMLRKDGSANLARMTYGVLCAGMFLSFVGTVLGGLWADYSWGRFWGWDPKENGALLIVLWIALILHARWGGMVKHRGLAVLSVLGIIVTSWSWFGTNFLGVGLHSYGFRQGAMTTLILIDLGFLAIAGVGTLPLHMWTSFAAPEPVTPSSNAHASRSQPVGV